jgi:hypothetical protein
VTDDVWIGQTCTIEDVSTGEIWSTYVTDIDQTNDRILVNAAAPFTVVATDKIRVYREKSPAYVQSTVFQTTLTEGYAADGSEPTMEQAVYMIMQMLTEFAINNGVLTVKRLDGSTTAATFTLDDPTEPTSITRSS